MSREPPPAARDGQARTLAERVVDTVPDPLLVLNDALRCVSANRACREAFALGDVAGRPLPEVLGARWCQPPLADALRALVREARPFDGLETPVPVPGGGERTFLCYGHPLGAGSFLLAMKDVTEREMAQELQQIVEAAPDAVLFVDASGRIERVNARAESLFGYPREAMLGQPVEMLIPEHLRPRHEAHRRAFARAPAVRPMGSGLELHARRRDGREFPVDVNLSVIALKGRTLTAAAVRDVTVHKQAERELARAKEAADLANLTKSRFLAAAGHDLRQPLQSLSMYLGTVRRAPEQLRAGVGEKMARSLEAMGDLLDSLLDISKLDAGAVEPEPRDIPVKDVLERVATYLEPQAAARGLRLAVAPTSAWAHTDPVLLERIVTNFVANAIRYTDGGRVLVGCRRRGGGVQVQVWDTGVGIPSDCLDHVFEEYVQLRNPGGDRRQGLGLGLAVVRRLADLLGHPLEVRSTPGTGSMFAVTLPPAHSVAEAASQGPDAAYAPASGAGTSVLLVDDDAAILDATGMLLDACGFEVRTAASAEEAIAAAAGRAPDAVVADYRLPAGDGFEVVRRIRALAGREVPAIIMTGDITARDRRDALPGGCTLVHKPVDVDELLRALAEATSRPVAS